jgi:exopolysaccharide production protein ExoZ
MAAAVDRTFRSIQALRGIAALLVTIFHAGLRVDPAETIFRVGNAGVDIFFVISGFVMWTTTSSRATPPAIFLRHRFIRLVPMYWLATLAMVAGAALVPQAFPRAMYDVSHVLLSLGFVPHVGPDGGMQPVLGQGWTLNFEVFFYLLFALALVLPVQRRFVALAIFLLALPVLRGFAQSAGVVAEDQPWMLLLSPLLIEFLGGIALAVLVLRGWRPRGAWGWGAMALGAALLALLPTPPADDDLQRLWHFGGPALLIVGGAVAAELAGSLRIGRLAMLLGAASYSIYLSHTFAISALGKLWPASLPGTAFMATATLFALIAGVLVYAWIEQPLLGVMRGGRRAEKRLHHPP